MFVELVVTHEDLRALLVRAFPVTIVLDEPGDRLESEGTAGTRCLALGELTDFAIVPGAGVRLTCGGLLHWPLLGIDAPLSLSSLRVLLVPEVMPSPTGEGLSFRLALEHVDIAGVPSVLDSTITHAVNARLAALALSWDFSRTFARVVPLPALLDPLESLSLHAAWGKVRITEEAVVFAFSLHNALGRRGESPEVVAPVAMSSSLARRHEPRPRVQRSPLAAPTLAAAALFGLAAGAAFFALRSVTSRW